jgi:hypothetical protein
LLPQEIHTKGPVRRAQLGNDASHHGHGFKIGLKAVGSIVFVAEHNSIHPAIEEIPDILSHPVDHTVYL